MNSVRTSRLSHELLSRQAVHYDIATKERLVFKKRSKVLNKYYGKDNIFGSFTSLPKLGINPQTGYKTPVGIYSYPVDYILDKVSGDLFDVPFVSNQPYLNIFSVSKLDRTLKFDMYDTGEIDNFRGRSSDGLESEEYNRVKDLVLKINDYVNSTIDKIPLNYYYWSPDSEIKWKEWYEKLKKATGFDGDSGDGVSDIIMNRGGIALFNLDNILSPKKFPLGPVLDEIRKKIWRSERSKVLTFPYENRIIGLPEVQAMGMEAYADFKNTVVLGKDQRVVCDQAFAWNCTRHLSGLNPMKWTGLMRRIGLIGAVDNDTGTIHENEPTQAVFFDPSSIKVLEVIQNTPPRKSGTSYYRSHEFSKWAADTGKHMESAVNSFTSALRMYLMDGSRSDQGNVFARLSWLQQHARNFFKDHPVMIKGIVTEIDSVRTRFIGDKRVLDKITRILESFLG